MRFRWLFDSCRMRCFMQDMCRFGLYTFACMKIYLYVQTFDSEQLVQIPRLNSTFPSLPPFSQNCSSRDCAKTACLWGKAAKARGRAKMEVPRINPALESVTDVLLVSGTAYQDSQVESSLVFASATVSAVTAQGSRAAAP